MGAGGFEPPKSKTTDLQSAPFGHSGTLPYINLRFWFKPDKKVELVDGQKFSFGKFYLLGHRTFGAVPPSHFVAKNNYQLFY